MRWRQAWLNPECDEDGLTYDFVLRQGVKFHNGDSVTAEDVKFSFERYRGAAHKTLKDHVAGVDAVDPRRVRIRLKQPWPDFMTYYGSPATGLDGSFRRSTWRRSGRRVQETSNRAGPYRFVSFTPGVELVLEAHEQYWRKAPSV